MTKAHMANSRRIAGEAYVSQHVPYVRHVTDSILSTKNGQYITVIEVTGLSFETEDQATLDTKQGQRARIWQGIADDRLVIYNHIIRQRAHDYPASQFSSPWAQKLDNAYQRHVSEQKMFQTRQFITIVRRPAKGKVHLVPELTKLVIGRIDEREKLAQQQAAIEHLEEATGQLVQNLQAYDARVLRLEEAYNGRLESEALSFLYYLLNLDDTAITAPEMALNQYLPASRISFGKEALEIRGARPDALHLASMLSLKEYPAYTQAGMLDKLLRLPHEFIVCQSFAFAGRQKTIESMRLQQRKISSGGDGAESLQADVDEAIDDVASGLSCFGYHHMTIMPHGSNASELKKALNEVIAACMDSGIIPVREDMNMEAAFWAQLPGNMGYTARTSMVSNQNFAGLASLHTFPVGRAHGNHWGEAVSLLATTSNSPYYFNFHERDVGNFTLIGPTGTGKTVLLSFLVAQAQRLTPRTFYFDKDRGAELFIRAIGGHYTVVRAGEPTGLNPFQLPDTQANREFLAEFIKVLATIDDNTPLSTDDERQIAAAIEANYQVEPEYRNLRQLALYFSGYAQQNRQSLSQRLEKWHSGRERAWLFDNDTDTLTLDHMTAGFDLTSILDTPYARVPWMMLIFHRIDQMLDGTRTLIMLDEGWKLLDDDVFAARIKDWEKTIRKQNGLLGFATQSPSDALRSDVGHAIIEQSPTKIFLPNHLANARDYCDGFGLSEHELQLIRSIIPESRQFLIKHGHHSVIAKLDLSGMDEFIDILSGRTETVLLAERLRQEHGDKPENWLAQFHEERKAV